MANYTNDAARRAYLVFANAVGYDPEREEELARLRHQLEARRARQQEASQVDQSHTIQKQAPSYESARPAQQHTEGKPAPEWQGLPQRIDESNPIQSWQGLPQRVDQSQPVQRHSLKADVLNGAVNVWNGAAQKQKENPLYQLTMTGPDGQEQTRLVDQDGLDRLQAAQEGAQRRYQLLSRSAQKDAESAEKVNRRRDAAYQQYLAEGRDEIAKAADSYWQFMKDKSAQRRAEEQIGADADTRQYAYRNPSTPAPATNTRVQGESDADMAQRWGIPTGQSAPQTRHYVSGESDQEMMQRWGIPTGTPTQPQVKTAADLAKTHSYDELERKLAIQNKKEPEYTKEQKGYIDAYNDYRADAMELEDRLDKMSDQEIESIMGPGSAASQRAIWEQQVADDNAEMDRLNQMLLDSGIDVNEKAENALTSEEEVALSQHRMDAQPEDVRDLLYQYQTEYALTRGYIDPEGTEFEEIFANAPRDFTSGVPASEQLDEAMEKTIAQIAEKVGEDQLDDLLFNARHVADYDNTQRMIERNYNAVHTGSGLRDTANATLMSAGATVTPFWSGVQAMSGNLEHRPEGYGGNVYSPAFGSLNWQESAQGEVANRIYEETGSEIAVNLYNIGMSAARSYVGARATGWAGELLSGFAAKGPEIAQAVYLGTSFGAGAGTSQYKENREKGIPLDDAQWSAIASGVWEVATEYVSLEQLTDILQANNPELQKRLASSLIAAATNASEEGAATILNGLSDWFINRDLSTYEKRADEYHSDGLSWTDAYNKAAEDLMMDAAGDALAGALSGGASAAAANVYNYVSTGSQADTQYSADYDYSGLHETAQQALDRNAFSSEGAREAAQNVARLTTQMQDLQEIGQEPSRAMKRELKDNVDTMIRVEAVNAPERKTLKMEQLDEMRDMDADDWEFRRNEARVKDLIGVPTGNITQAMFSAQTADQLVAMKQETDASADETTRIQGALNYRAAKDEMIGQGRATAGAFERAESMPSVAQMYDAGLAGETIETGRLPQRLKEAYALGQTNKLLKANHSSMEEGDSIRETSAVNLETGEDVNINGVGIEFDRNKGTRTTYVTTDTGEHLDLNKLRLPDAQRKILEFAQEQSSQEMADAVLDNAPTQTPVSSFRRAFKHLESYAAAGMSLEQAEKKMPDFSFLKPAQRERIFELARSQREAEIFRDGEQKGVTVAFRGNGTVTVDPGAKVSDDVLSLVEGLSKITGTNTHISKDIDDRVNGSLDTAYMRVLLSGTADLNSAKNQQLNTILHENIGEYLRAYNREGSRRIQDTLLQYMLDHEQKDVEDLLQRYQRKYNDVEGTKSMFDAMNEFFNDSIAGLFADEAGIHDLTDWMQKKLGPQETTSFLQKTANFFKNIGNAIRNALSGGQLSKASEHAYRMASDKAADIRRMILDEMDVAIENVRNAEVVPGTQGRTSYSADPDLRDYIDKVLDHPEQKLRPFILQAQIPSNVATEISNIVGFDVTGYSNDINSSTIKHIDSRHGAKGKADQSMADRDTVAKIGYVFENATKVWDDGGTTNAFLNSDKTPAKTVVLQAQTPDGYYYIVEAVPDVANKKMHVVSARINKKDTSPRTSHAIKPSSYAQSVPLANNVSNQNVPQRRNSVNVDSAGRQLSQGQQDYFKDSKVRDENGALKVMYHGTTSTAFTTFDPRYSDDGRSLFFTDSPEVAKTYSGSDRRFAPSRFESTPMTYEELAEAVANASGGESSLGRIKSMYYIQTGNTRERFGSLEDAQKAYEETWLGRDDNSFDRSSGNYEVYLNLQNPLVIDTHNSYWNDVHGAEHTDALLNVKRDGDEYIVKLYNAADFDVLYHGRLTGDELARKFGRENVPGADVPNATAVVTVSTDDYSILQNYGTTREISERAKANGHDGVILKNLIDMGVFRGAENTPSTIAIAFSSEQVKSVANQRPTTNPDIRYSAQVDEAIRKSFGANARVETDADGEFQLATSDDANAILFNDARYSLRTVDKTNSKLRDYSETRKKLGEALKQKGHDAEDIDVALNMVQRMSEFLDDVAGGYAEMRDSLDTNIFYDITGQRQVLRSLVKNGEYPVNIDFMTICKKRQAYQRVLTDLIDDGTFAAVNYNPDAIAEVNNILRQQGYETACLACFVESRRLQIQKWSETFCDAWNRQVEKVAGKNAKPFNFGLNEKGATSYSAEEIERLAREYESAGKKNDKGNLNLGKGAVEEKMGRLLERVPTLARTLTPGDILKTNGAANLRGNYGDIYSLLLQWYGSNTPKVNQDFNPYNGEIMDLGYNFVKKATGDSLTGSKAYQNWARKELAKELGVKELDAAQKREFKGEIEERAIRKYLYDIGGARLQSFSDFLIENSLDYFQMVADLSARKFPMHAYSKEISFNRIFGQTGMKINMSLIPVVNRAAGRDMAGLNPDGSYAGWGDFERHMMLKGNSFIQSIGWKDAIALQLDPRYSKNIGTIAIGISDAHIRKMLQDPLIRMVIPYHKSGMNPDFARRMNVDYYTDYTDFQNTTVKQFYDLDGNEVDGFGKSAKVDLHYDFNEAAQRLGDARAAADEYLAWCAEDHPVYIGKRKVGTAKFTPAFEQFTTGEGSENYYKVLEDFNMYDAITEEYAPQEAVKAIFADENHALSDQELQEYADRLRATGEFSDTDIQKYVQKAGMSMEDIIREEAGARNKYHRDTDAKYDETYGMISKALTEGYSRAGEQAAQVMNDGSDLRRSVKVDDKETLDFLENQDHITVYRTFQQIGDGLYAPMNAMENGKLGYKSQIGVWEQATEDPSKVKNGKFPLRAGGYTSSGKNRTTWAAYNPYLHSSNLVFNDQFAGAYDRPNLVVVECEVPVSELTSGYHADQAKDPVGWLEWKSGSVANALKKKGIERKVMLSRWMKPVRIMDNAEVARIYKESLDGTGIVVPWNVVSPPLREELEKLGVEIDYGYQSAVKASFADKFPDTAMAKETDSLRRSLTGVDDDWWSFGTEAQDRTYTAMSSILEDGLNALAGQPVDEKAIKSIARKLRSQYSSTYDLNTFSDNLAKVFAYAQQNKGVDYQDMMRILEEVARPVLEESNMVVGREEQDAFIEALRPYTIKLTDRMKDEVVSRYGSYQEFRKAMKGIKISNNGTPLDTIWGEMMDRVPGMLDADVPEADMPIMLADVLDSLSPHVQNMYGESMDEAATDLALEIVENYFQEAGMQAGKEAVAAQKAQNAQYRENVRAKAAERLRAAAAKSREANKAYRARVREKYQQNLADTKAEMRERYRAQARELRADRDNRLAELKAANRQRNAEARERRAIAHEKSMINSRAGDLTKWLLDPSDQHHVPKKLENVVSGFLGSIDFVDPHIQKTADGRYRTRIFDGFDEAGNRTYRTTITDTREEALQQYREALEAGKGSQGQRRWFDTMGDLAKLYQDADGEKNFDDAEVGDFIQSLDPALAEELQDMLQRNRGVAAVSLLGSQDLHTISQVLRNITRAVNQENRAYSTNAKISELGDKVIELGSRGYGNRKNHSKGVGNVLDFMQLHNATPVTVFRRMGDAGDQLYKMLRHGQNQKVRDIREAQEYTLGENGILKGVNMKGWSGRSAKTTRYVLQNGQQIELTPAQVMTLYELSKREQAMLHQAGGFSVERQTIKGKEIRQKDLHLTDADIANITGTLTQQQKDIADGLQKFLADNCSRWGNDTSLNMYGYEKFGDPNYFPIRTDKTALNSQNNNQKQSTLNAIKNMGFTKKVVPNAQNPIVISDIFDVFTSHVQDMATYHGYAAPVTDLIRFLNHKNISEQDENGFVQYSTVKGALEEIFGMRGENYIDTLIRSLNEQEQSSYFDGGILSGLTSNAKAAAIAGNIRVVIQQPTAYMRAGAAMGYNYLAKAAAASGDIRQAAREMQDNTSDISWWKSQGFWETSIGPSMKQMLTGDETAVEKATDALMKPAGLADDATWRVIYRAVYMEQLDAFKQAGKDVTGDEFTEAVNDRFDEVIDRTQVVDSTLHRSQMMRAKDPYSKMLTNFMAEPTKSWNMFLQAYNDAVLSAQENGGKIAPKAARTVTRAAGVYTVTNLVLAAAQSLVDAFRKGKDEDEWLERYLAAYRENFLDNMNPLDMLPVVKDLGPIMKAAIEGQTWGSGDNSRMDMTTLNNLAQAFYQTSQAIQGNPKLTGWGLFRKDLQALSQVLGLPAYNVLRDAEAIYNNIPSKPFGLPDTPETSISAEKKAKKTEVFSAIDNGGDAFGAIETAVGKGYTYEGLESGLTTQYKQQYIDLMEAGDPEAKVLENRLAMVYDYLNEKEGQKKSDSAKRVQKWYSDYQKASGEPEDEPETAVPETTPITTSMIDAVAGPEIEEPAEETPATERQEWEPYVSDYQGAYDAIDSGDGNVTDTVNELISSGKKASTVKSTLTKTYKPKMQELYATDKDAAIELKQRLIEAYMATGMTRDEANDKINEWVNE